MTNYGSEKTAAWPMPKFRFEVNLVMAKKEVVFQEVLGLDAENQIIEYGSKFQTVKMAGIEGVGNVTLKRGIFVNDNTFWDWENQIKMNTIKRRAVLIKLVDEFGETMMTWTLSNAWPTKIIGTDIMSDGNEVAVDTIEIAYEQLTSSL